MKDIVTYINETKEDLKRFRIDDLKQELIDNKVSKTRINEIIEYFKTVLGEGSYYCISQNNPEHGNIYYSTGKGEFTLKKLIDLDNNEPEDSEMNKWCKEINQKRQKHNDEFNSLDKELQNKINKLNDSIVDLRLSKPFKFGRYNKGCSVKLVGAICKMENNYIPCIVQIQEEAKVIYTNITFYFNTKDID